MRLFFFILLALFPAPMFAQSGPSFDCAKAESAAETLICDDAELAALDRRVADRYAAALAVIQAMDAGVQDATNDLRATQRGWMSGRDACWTASDLRDCVEFSYQRREAELVALWMLEEPTAIATWACDGNPANEVVTYLFDTERSSVRIERGDSIATGVLSPTGSGSLYEAEFGRSIWIKGDEATYREPDPDGRSYDCVVSRRD